MKMIDLMGISIALAMDAFAVAVAAGVNLRNVNFRQVFRLSWHFGFFQAAMPVIGWFAGLSVRSFIEQYDHWVAFCLLAFIGVNMIRGAFETEKEKKEKRDPTKGATMVMLSVATSIDALTVGFSISLLAISIWVPALIIGLVAGAFTIAGMHIGCRMASASHLGRYAELLGGLVLIAIGINILHGHGALPF